MNPRPPTEKRRRLLPPRFDRSVYYERTWRTYKAGIVALIAVIGALLLVVTLAVANRIDRDNCLDHAVSNSARTACFSN